MRLFLDLSSWLQGIAEALMKAGAVYKYDLSLPVEKMYDLVEKMRQRLGKPSYNFIDYEILFPVQQSRHTSP